MFKKYLSNPSFLFLLAGNIYCIWYYQNNSGAFSTVVWIYWFQSITIGLFNFIDLLTIKNIDSASSPFNEKPSSSGGAGCAAWFFLVHFGFFHLGYAIFLLVDFGVKDISRSVLLLGIGAFFLETILNFIRQKQLEKTMSFNVGTMFFLPYLRVVPMHLMILLPVFFHLQPSIVFLGLKMTADILSFMIYQNIYGKSKVADNP